MNLSDLIDKLEDIACNITKDFDDALAVTDAIKILSLLKEAGIDAERTPRGIVFTQKPIFCVVAKCGSGKIRFETEMAKLRAEKEGQK